MLLPSEAITPKTYILPVKRSKPMLRVQCLINQKLVREYVFKHTLDRDVPLWPKNTEGNLMEPIGYRVVNYYNWETKNYFILVIEEREYPDCNRLIGRLTLDAPDETNTFWVRDIFENSAVEFILGFCSEEEVDKPFIQEVK